MGTRLSNVLFYVVGGTILTVFAVMCTYPFYYILIYSLSDSMEAAKGMFLLPRGFTLKNYTLVLGDNRILDAFFVSTARSVIGTLLALLFSSVFAFVILQKELRYRKLIYRLCVVTMYFHAGLIPWYITMISYGLKNSFLLYVLPSAVAPFFIILFKTYFENIPEALVESAVIDGANHYIVYSRIILPLSIPVLAAVAVFSAVGEWNSWTDNFYLVSDPKLQTLQLVLLDFLRQSEALARAVNMDNNFSMAQQRTLSPLTVRMTITIVSIVPILLVYPFLQRFFVKGLMLGAVKG